MMSKILHKQLGRYSQDAAVVSQPCLAVSFELLSPGAAPSSHLAFLQFFALIIRSALFRNLVSNVHVSMTKMWQLLLYCYSSLFLTENHFNYRRNTCLVQQNQITEVGKKKSKIPTSRQGNHRQWLVCPLRILSTHITLALFSKTGIILIFQLYKFSINLVIYCGHFPK